VKSIAVQQNIQSLIQAGRLIDAFQTALSFNDLTLVVFTCELLTPPRSSTLLHTPSPNPCSCPSTSSCPWMDLGEKTEVKDAYLHEALVNLDPENPITKVHITAVLSQLEQSLKK
jgi:enhancer of mRNA-decapping protein 4